MSQDKLETCKQFIRSTLITFQKGCLLSKFNQEYKEMIGERFPFKEFGFQKDIDFLYSMPDVVQVTRSRAGDYHLIVVPDAKTKHIQQMVAKQKPAKGRSKTLSHVSESLKSRYNKPPRFSKPPLRQIDSLREINPSRTPFQPRMEPLISFTEEHKLPPKLLPKEPQNPKSVIQEEPKLPPKTSPKEEVIALVQYCNNQIALNDLLFEYKRMYQKDLSLSKFGFSSVEECIEDIPELCIQKIKGCAFVVFEPESSNADWENCNVLDDPVLLSDRKSQNYDSEVQQFSEASSTHNNECSNYQNATVPYSLRVKLQKVAERFTNGIWASEFLSCFEEATGAALDLHSLGYRSLNDLIDDVPDIFIRKPVAGSRKDYIIYSVNKSTQINALSLSNNNPQSSGVADVYHVIVNVRKILQAYSEGIPIDEFFNIYSINCKDTLHITDFGFDDLESFLRSIKEQVPLRIDLSKGVKTIHLLLSDNLSFIKPPEAPQEEVIPSDAMHPEFKFKQQNLPTNFDFSEFIPVYMSSVAHPDHLYIQLQGEETADAFVKLATNIENFYNGSKSMLYVMKSVHIKVGASCIAKWPSDEHWYRAEIMAVPNSETVSVLYVDYGTKDIIPISLLRYAKKEFTDLPAQALRCRLAFLKPPKNATKWPIESRNKILSLCEDVPLMAKIEEIRVDGIYSILLCDTNGDDDVYINDVLRNEGLADYAVGNTNEEIPAESIPASPMEYHYNLSPMQALQAQCFLQAFVTVAPCFAQNEHYLSLMRQVSMYCSNPNPSSQNVGLPPPILPPAPGPPGFNNLQLNTLSVGNSSVSNASNIPSAPSMAIGNSNMLSNASCIPSPPFIANTETKLNIQSSFNVANSNAAEAIMSPKSIAATMENEEDSESDVFYDDDDEIFQQFCQKFSASKTRHVKRVLLGDGYKIHIIVFESKAYASSGDISQLIWSSKEADYLFRRLQLKDVDIPFLDLTEDNNEELFQQLEKFNVKGVKKITGCKDSIILYPLKVVIKILNLFGHPSVTLRTKLTEEIANFNPSDSEWMNCSTPERVESEEENFSAATDDDKIEKLCLFDLFAMKESVTLRRKKLINNLLNNEENKKSDKLLNKEEKNKISDEIDKLEQLQRKVLQRIKEIKEICNVFA